MHHKSHEVRGHIKKKDVKSEDGGSVKDEGSIKDDVSMKASTASPKDPKSECSVKD